MRDEDIKYIHELEKRVQELEEDYKFGSEQMGLLVKDRNKLEEQNRRYRRALQFYADEKTWELSDPYEPMGCEAWRDNGKKARQALEGDGE